MKDIQTDQFLELKVFMWKKINYIFAISLRSCAASLKNATNYDYDHFVFTQQWAESVCDCDDTVSTVGSLLLSFCL